MDRNFFKVLMAVFGGLGVVSYLTSAVTAAVTGIPRRPTDFSFTAAMASGFFFFLFLTGGAFEWIGRRVGSKLVPRPLLPTRLILGVLVVAVATIAVIAAKPGWSEWKWHVLQGGLFCIVGMILAAFFYAGVNSTHKV